MNSTYPSSSKIGQVNFRQHQSEEGPPAGVEPTLRPYKGRVLAVDTTEAKVETVGVEPTSSSVQARCSPLSCIPVNGVTGRIRTGAAGFTVPDADRLHHGHHEAGTTEVEPAASRLTNERSLPLSYVSCE